MSISSQILRFLEDAGTTAARLLRSAKRLLDEERETDFRTEIPLITRLRWYSRGFSSKSGVLYDFSTYRYSDYMTDVAAKRRKRANGPERAFSNQKYPYYLLFEHYFSGRHPPIYALIDGRDVYDLELNRLDVKTSEWLKKTIAEHGRLILKPQEGAGGEGVKLVELDGDGIRVNGTNTTLRSLTGRIIDSGRYLAVEYVEQAEYAAKIYPQSVNTIRVITLWDYEREEPYVAHAIHRFGTSESRPVDNWDSGGLGVGIELETGELQRGTRDPVEPRVEWYETHPDTGAQLTGVEIPRWDDIKRECCRMAEHFWYMPMKGWDIVISADDKITVIEANSWPTMNMMQVHRPLFVDPRTHRFFEHHSVI